MAQMQALLKIKADVDGEGKVNALGRAIGGLSSTAGKVSGGLKGLAGAAGGLSGALGSLVPLATGAGLAAMAKGAIDAADNMNDLSQKTGVSVESLSKFQQAANASGTSIEGVGAAMIKLNRNLATSNPQAAETLTALGISATDASGKLKSTDAIMLEVADKFAKMPDGANKTAAAMSLFGKAGADMIPLLNGGSKAISDLSATMTTEFAKGADSLNDKLAALQGKLLELGVNIGTALMPALTVIADLVLNAANAFAAMPGPLQAIVGGVVALAAAFVVLAPAISAAVSIAGVLAGLNIGATIAGWAAVAGPAIIAIKAAFAGLLTFFTGTLLPGLLTFFSGPVGWTVLAVAAVVAMAIAFREPIGEFFTWLGGAIQEGFSNLLTTLTGLQEPIMEFFTWLGGAIQEGFSKLMALLQGIFVQPFVDLWNNVLRGPITAMFTWLGEYLQTSMENALALAYAVFVLPWLLLWDAVREPVTEFFGWIGGAVQAGMKTALDLAYAVFVQPWVDLWNNVLRDPVSDGIDWIQDAWKKIAGFFEDNVTTPISKAWTDLTDFLPKAASAVGTEINKIWKGISKFFTDNVTTPIRNIWDAIVKLLSEKAIIIANNIADAWKGISKFFTDNVTTPISKAWTTVTEFLPKAINTAKTAIVSVFTSIGTTIKSILNSIVGGIVIAVNRVINEINFLVNRANAISAKVNGPQIPTLPKLSVPEFAQGAVVTGPTLAVVGEGGEPEYIIPASKMQTASQNYLGGARGGAVIPAFADGGFVGSARSGAAASSPAIRDSGNPTINITTGPVVQFGGEQYVTVGDMQAAMQATARGVLGSLRNPTTRISLGLA